MRRAVNGRRKVCFDCEDEGQRRTQRTIRPLGPYFWGQAWTLAAYCELRQDFRNFRIDRAANIQLKETFELVSPCTLDDYLAAVVDS